MKINFTKKEYRALVTMIEIADWVITSQDVEPQEGTAVYSELRKNILSQYKTMGMEAYYTEENGEFFETKEYEDSSEYKKYIDEYDESTFWSELIARLSDRDYAEKYGKNDSDRIENITNIETTYVNEIESFGIKNIGITKRTITH